MWHEWYQKMTLTMPKPRLLSRWVSCQKLILPRILYSTTGIKPQYLFSTETNRQSFRQLYPNALFLIIDGFFRLDCWQTQNFFAWYTLFLRDNWLLCTKDHLSKLSPWCWYLALKKTTLSNSFVVAAQALRSARFLLRLLRAENV